MPQIWMIQKMALCMCVCMWKENHEGPYALVLMYGQISWTSEGVCLLVYVLGNNQLYGGILCIGRFSWPIKHSLYVTC